MTTAADLTTGEIITFDRGGGYPRRTSWRVQEQTPDGPRVYRLGGSAVGVLPATTELRRTPANSAWEPQP